jgi:hypothetical protein
MTMKMLLKKSLHAAVG